MALSALIVEVPQAEPLVRDLRERFDPSANLGVPAQLAAALPAGGIAVRCKALVLIENTSGRWAQLCGFRLGTSG